MRVPEGWRSVRLGDVARESRRRNDDSAIDAERLYGVFKDEGMVPMRDRVRGASVERCKVVKPGSFAYNPMRLNIGSIACWTGSEDAIVSPDYVVFECDQRQVNHQYLNYLRKGRDWAKFTERTGDGGVRVRIYFDHLAEFRFFLPPLSEQHRMVEVLSSVDDTIKETQAVTEQTRLAKTSLLKGLLGRGIGHARFKRTDIGDIPETWQVVSLGRIAEFQPGYAFKSSEFTQAGDKLLRGSNVGVGEIVWEEGNTKFLSSSRRDEFFDYILKRGDIVVAMDRPFITAGFKTARVNDKDLPGLLLQRVGRFLPSSRCNEEWLWQVVSSGTLRDTLEKRQVGTDLPHISKKDIESCQVALPPIDEQIKIANVLCEFDHAIAANVEKRRRYEHFRSGLLSDLLTGRKRVSADALLPAE